MTENLPTKDKIIGASLNNLKELVLQYATQGTNILLLGPRGSGKELFAKLYQEGTRRKEFAPINCSGIASIWTLRLFNRGCDICKDFSIEIFTIYCETVG